MAEESQVKTWVESAIWATETDVNLATDGVGE